MIWVFLGQKKRKNVVNFDPAMDKLLKKSCCCSKYEKMWTLKLYKINWDDLSWVPLSFFGNSISDRSSRKPEFG